MITLGRRADKLVCPGGGSCHSSIALMAFSAQIAPQERFALLAASKCDTFAACESCAQALQAAQALC